MEHLDGEYWAENAARTYRVAVPSHLEVVELVRVG